LEPLRKRTHRKDRDFSKGLLWGSLKVVRVIEGLVSVHPNEILEKRGFSLFCHEELLVIGYGDEKWRAVTPSHVLARSVVSLVTSFSNSFLNLMAVSMSW